MKQLLCGEPTGFSLRLKRDLRYQKALGTAFGNCSCRSPNMIVVFYYKIQSYTSCVYIYIHDICESRSESPNSYVKRNNFFNPLQCDHDLWEGFYVSSCLQGEKAPMGHRILDFPCAPPDTQTSEHQIISTQGSHWTIVGDMPKKDGT